MASLIAREPHLNAETLRRLVETAARRRWRRTGFYRMLNRMLFHAARPHERYKVLQRFYRLPPGLIGRFYAGESRRADKLRILTGKPPVPIVRAVRALLTGRPQ
jgi:lycopene beta-cyclase